MKLSKRVGVCIGLFVGLIALYVFTLTVMYSFGNEAVLANVNGAISILQNEGDYPDSYLYEIPSRLDNYTDKLMLSKTLKAYEGDSFKQAMDNSGYARYWHGYLVWLKPLLKFFTFPDIRVLMGCAQILVLSISFYFITKALGFKVSIPYIISWISVYGVVSTMSLQYFSSFFVTGIACIVLGAACSYAKTVHRFYYVLFFGIIGSLINFLDLLTFPVISLCVPLVLLVMWEERQGESVKRNVCTIIISCLAWGIGYGVTWFTKWLIATFALGRNVINDALNQILFRTNGSQDYPIDRIQVLKSNLSCIKILEWFFNTPWIWIVIILMALLLGNKKRLVKGLPLLLVALVPYVWYEVLCSHSAIHVFFTYKSQMGTVFALGVYVLFCLEPSKEQMLKWWEKSKKLVRRLSK